MDSNNIDDIVNLIASSSELDSEEIRNCILSELENIDAAYQNDYLKGMATMVSHSGKPISSIDDVVQLSTALKREKNILTTEDVKIEQEEGVAKREKEIDNTESVFQKIAEAKQQQKEVKEERKESEIKYGDNGEPLDLKDYFSDEYLDIIYNRIKQSIECNDFVGKEIATAVVRHQINEKIEERIMKENNVGKEDANRIRIYKSIASRLIISYLRESGPSQSQYKKSIIDAYKKLNYSDEDIEKLFARIEATKTQSKEEIDNQIGNLMKVAGITDEKEVRRVETFSAVQMGIEEIYEHEAARDDCDTKIYSFKADSERKMKEIESTSGLSEEDKDMIIADERKRAGASASVEVKDIIRLEQQLLKCEMERYNSPQATATEKKQAQERIEEIQANIANLSNGIETDQVKQKKDEYNKVIEQIEKLDEESSKIKELKNPSEEARQVLSVLLRKRTELVERREFLKTEYSFEIMQDEKIAETLVKNRINNLDREIAECKEGLINEDNALTRERLEKTIKEKEKEKIDCQDPELQNRLNFSEEEREAAKKEVRAEMIKQSMASLRSRTVYASAQTEGLSIDDPKFIKTSVDVLKRSKEIESNLCQLGLIESERTSTLSKASFLTPKDRMMFLLCKRVATINVTDAASQEDNQELIDNRRKEAQKLKDKIDAVTRIEKLQEKWINNGLEGNRLTRINDAAIDLFQNIANVSMSELESSSEIKRKLDEHGITTEEDKTMLMELFNCVDTSNDRTNDYGDNPDKRIHIKPFKASLFTDAIKVNEDRLVNKKRRDEIRGEYESKIEKELLEKIESKRSRNQMLADITTEVSELGLEEAMEKLAQDTKEFDSGKEQTDSTPEINEQ